MDARARAALLGRGWTGVGCVDVRRAPPRLERPGDVLLAHELAARLAADSVDDQPRRPRASAAARAREQGAHAAPGAGPRAPRPSHLRRAGGPRRTARALR